MSTNGRVSKSWSQPWTHLRVDRCSPSSCRVTFDHAPINAITAATVEELVELVELIDQDHDLNVVVFDSANADFYLTGPTRMDAWIELLDRLSRAPVVSIASIRGRARGAGSEFVLACDMRFSSRENSVLGRFEVGVGVARLSRLVGRGRALEILLGADDLAGPRAERYGLVNRAIADDQLDQEVEEIASRLARFDHDVIARTKSCVDQLALTELMPRPAGTRGLAAPLPAPGAS
jgi:enoyl-CoA hydratase/carnithine racemase